MLHEVIKVEATGSKVGTLTTYILENYEEIDPDRKRPMVLICPGGAYEWCSQREAEAVAMQFLSRGMQAAILRYDTHKNEVEFPQELKEAAWSMAYIRNHAEQYHVDPDKIVILGFSAGGHLAASLGVFWQEAWLEELMGMSADLYKPNGLVLGYPVITSGEFAHVGSIENLLGNQLNEEMKEKVSLEKQVTDKVPPVFMWHTFEDGSVPVENSLMFAAALRKANVSTEYHMFPRGGHGLALANEETSHPDKREIQKECQIWINLCENWIKSTF